MYIWINISLYIFQLYERLTLTDKRGPTHLKIVFLSIYTAGLD